jgi:F0F1-type ATP synthase epsilon subunit
MRVSIYSLRDTLFDGEATSLTCPTRTGEITILEHHHPLITILNKGAVKLLDLNAQEHFFEVGSGLVEVQAHNSIRLIVDK